MDLETGKGPGFSLCLLRVRTGDRDVMESMPPIWAEVKQGESDACTQMELGFKTILTGQDDEPDGKRM